MTSTSPLPPTVKIVAQEPVAKIADRQTYWIRIVANKQAPQPCYAIAAMRCENREEIHWLSACHSTPGEAARLMRSGFELANAAAQLTKEIVQQLVNNGNAIVIEATDCSEKAA